jgi:hypothetical protein
MTQQESYCTNNVSVQNCTYHIKKMQYKNMGNLIYQYFIIISKTQKGEYSSYKTLASQEISLVRYFKHVKYEMAMITERTHKTGMQHVNTYSYHHHSTSYSTWCHRKTTLTEYNRKQSYSSKSMFKYYNCFNLVSKTTGITGQKCHVKIL